MVICHGFKGFKDWGFFPHLAERLARAGFTAVSFNFSGSGVGEDGETFVARALRDLDIVLGALNRGDLGPKPTVDGLYGHGLGGAVAVLRATRDPAMWALVTWDDPGLEVRPGTALDARRASGDVRAPWLALEIAESGSGAPPELERAVQATVAWFARHLA